MKTIGLRGRRRARAEAQPAAVREKGAGWVRAATLALAAVLAAGAALADSPEYPPGLFENSPLRRHGEEPPAAPSEAQPPDAMEPDAQPPDALAPDDCADIASRVFRSLAEVRAAHARCDGR